MAIRDRADQTRSDQAYNPVPTPPTGVTRLPVDLSTGILTDQDIADLCQGENPMISPFQPTQVRVNEAGHKILSYGLSSMGYDVTLDEDFLIFTNVNAAIIDPHNMTDSNYVKKKAQTDENGHKYVILPPNSYLLGVTKEYFRMPPDAIIFALGKSTYARAGLIINVTPIEPGFHGNVVIEAFNGTSSPMKVYAHEGIAQFMCFRASKRCGVSYGDRAGKYQGQRGMTTARI